MTGAFFIPDLEGGGAERVMLTLVGELNLRGHAVELVVGIARGALASELPAGVRVVELRRERLRSALPALVRYLRTRRPDYLMATLEHANVLALIARALARTKTPVVVRVANTPSEVEAGASTVIERLTLVLAHRLYHRADVLIAGSFGVADDLATFARVDPSAVKTLPNPAVRNGIVQLAAAPLSHPWFSSDQPPLILSVGSLRTKKNLPLLLDAFARVRRDREVRLLILGEGPERRNLERKTAALGLRSSVEMPGFSTNPYRYMSRCSVFALTSDREGLPAVLIEALRCGANVVSTDCRSGPREILDGGRYGRLVPTGDASALAEALAAALDDPWTPPPESWARYTVDRAADAYVQLLEDVAS